MLLKGLDKMAEGMKIGDITSEVIQDVENSYAQAVVYLNVQEDFATSLTEYFRDKHPSHRVKLEGHPIDIDRVDLLVMKKKF